MKLRNRQCASANHSGKQWYVVTCRKMPKGPMKLVQLGVFHRPDMDGYFTDTEYSALYGLAPNIQNAFEILDNVFRDARDEIKQKLERGETD